jgi:anti-anti-sigma factor
MSGATVDVKTSPDGTLVIHPHGVLDADNALDLRRTIVQAVRRVRPLQLVVDLSDLHELDAISVGTLAEACHLGDDHDVAVFLDNSHPSIATRLTAAGVPRHRLRNIAPAA